MYFRLFGSFSTSSLLKGPDALVDSLLRYMTSTPSNSPDWSLERKSSREPFLYSYRVNSLLHSRLYVMMAKSHLQSE